MDDKSYAIMFNGITDTIVQLEKMTAKLCRLQQKVEEIYMSCEEADIVVCDEIAQDDDTENTGCLNDDSEVVTATKDKKETF